MVNIFDNTDLVEIFFTLLFSVETIHIINSDDNFTILTLLAISSILMIWALSDTNSRPPLNVVLLEHLSFASLRSTNLPKK